MSKPVKSDGAVNAAVLRLCESDWGNLSREAIDAKLTDKDVLRQLKYATLCYAAYRYATGFGETNWHIHARIEATAKLSAEWRQFARLPGPTDDPLQGIEDALRASAEEEAAQ